MKKLEAIAMHDGTDAILVREAGTGKHIAFLPKDTAEGLALLVQWVNNQSSSPGIVVPQAVPMQRLWLGDRFVAHGRLWTHLGWGERQAYVARQHSPDSIALCGKGHGYRGDTLCSFDIHDVVEFQPPTAP